MWLFSPQNPRRTSSVPRPRPCLEVLEDRCLLSTSGSLDPSFGNGGTVTTAVTKGNDSAWGVLLQPNGYIITYGNSTSNSGDKFDLVRYTPSGGLDSTFGSGGIVTASGGNYDFQSAVLQADGKIVTLNGSFVARYNSGGSVDKTFGNRGQVTLPSGVNWNGALILQPMSNGSEDTVVLGETTVGNDEAIALVRYTSTGQLDTTFGSGGERITDVGSGYFNPLALALENGDIVVAGGTVAKGTQDRLWLVARYTANGSLDTTFNANGSQPGIVTTQIGTGLSLTTQPLSLLVQSDGKLVAVGEAINSSGVDSWGLVRYNTDGSLDSTFGSGGIVLSNLTPQGDTAIGSALQSNGEIVVAGWGGASSHQFEVGTYNSDGSPDTTFGTGGFVVQSFNSGSAAYGVAVQPADGKVVVAGSTSLSSGKSDFLLARYIGTTTPTTTTALAPTLKRVDNSSPSTPSALPSSTPTGSGSTLLAESAFANLIPMLTTSTRGASPNAESWSGFQVSVLGTLERDLSQWEDAMTKEVASLTQVIDELFADWDQTA